MACTKRSTTGGGGETIMLLESKKIGLTPRHPLQAFSEYHFLTLFFAATL
jgi:hypothetical protein